MLLLILLINLHKISVPKGGTFFATGPQFEHTGQQVDAIIVVKALGIVVTDYKIFLSYPYVSICKHNLKTAV